MSIVKRFRNKGLWLSICAFVPLISQQLGLSIIPHNYADVVNSVLGALVVLGILNNPESGDWYLNSKDEVVKDNTPIVAVPVIEDKEKNRPIELIAKPIIVEKNDKVKPTIIEKPQSPKEE